eukprot:6194838-Pleurochrysis_carterae.AAC.1
MRDNNIHVKFLLCCATQRHAIDSAHAASADTTYKRSLYECSSMCSLPTINLKSAGAPATQRSHICAQSEGFMYLLSAVRPTGAL